MKERLGKCYQLAGRYALDHPNSTLIHGTINGIKFTGIDFDNPHAWIEEGEEAYDLVLDYRLPKEVYYKLMQAKVIKKYNHNAMKKMILKTTFWGPWKGVKI